MTEKLRPPQEPKSHDIDPIVYDDRTILGLDPAVHWISWNNQQGQFPEIVMEITKHWNDRDWLEKLLNRMGYVADAYDSETNPKGIFISAPKQTPGSQRGLPQLRFFLLRAAGLTLEVITYMFGESNRYAQQLVHEHLEEIAARRKGPSAATSD